MLFQDLSPQVRFLNDAAHLLSQVAPQTSAFLMSRRSELLVENNVPIPDIHRQHVCSSCGHILIPGQGDTLKISTDKALRLRAKGNKKQQQSRPQKALATPAPHAGQRARPGGISKVILCAMCHRETKIKLEGPKPISRSRKFANQGGRGLQHVKLPEGSNEPIKMSANASSKKRAKNRKAGLQALLGQKQASAPSSGLGLSLSDFLKK